LNFGTAPPEDSFASYRSSIRGSRVKQYRLRQFQSTNPKIARLVFDLDESPDRHEILEVETDTAADGEEALTKLKEKEFSLILLDLKMPGIDGMEVLRQVSKIRPDIRIIILTAYDLSEYREASSAYADYFFSKDSLTTKNILTLVESILPTRA
jgi:CheY-like chemotaxis protein